jgi:hypothetical protein
MSIWGNRGSEPADQGPDGTDRADAPQAEIAHEGGAAAGEAPAFWRVPGQQAAPAGTTAAAEQPVPGHGRAPAEASGPAEAPAPAERLARAGERAALAGDGVVVIGDQTAAQDPVAAGAEEARVPAPGGARVSAPGVTRERWSEILATFVDDPRGSVKLAADAVDSTVEEFVASVRARQAALAAAWQRGDAGTEQLRTALRDYRVFWGTLQERG